MTCAYFSVSADVELADPVAREHLGERVLDDVLREGDGEVGSRLGSGSSSSGRRRVRRASRRAGAPRSGRKLKKIAVSRSGSRRGRPVDDDRLDELVGDIRGRSSAWTAATGSPAWCPSPSTIARSAKVGAIPAPVAVHRVVAAGDRGDAVGGQLGEVAHRRVRRNVSAVGERVDPGLLRREGQQRLAGGRCANGRRRARRGRAGARCLPRPKAPRSASFSKKLPSSIDLFTRTRSW